MSSTPSSPKVINLTAGFDQIKNSFDPTPAINFNGNQMTLFKVEGSYKWHVHDDSDEFFQVVDGELDIYTRPRTDNDEWLSDGREWAPIAPPYEKVRLSAVDMFVVPAGTPHRSSSAGCRVMFGLNHSAVKVVEDDVEEVAAHNKQ